MGGRTYDNIYASVSCRERRTLLARGKKTGLNLIAFAFAEVDYVAMLNVATSLEQLF